METTLLVALLAGVAIALILLIVLLLRPRGDVALREKLDALRGDSERIERVLREEQRAGRAELADTLDRLGGQLRQSLSTLTADNEKRLTEVRATLDTQLKALQADNAAQLEQMRRIVDEKLQATLNERLTASFRQVVTHLEAVQRGLGEMQTLASGVGDLNRVLSNVKNRGIFGESQLSALLQELLTPEQYNANVATVPGSAERVEFAVRLPGTEPGRPVWLPIDAKYPREIRRAAAHPRFRDPVPAHRKPVRRGAAPTRPVRGAAARTPRDAGRADHAVGAAQQPAHGFPDAGDRTPQQRGVADSRRGQDRIRQVRRDPRQDPQAARQRAQQPRRSGGQTLARDRAQIARGGIAAAGRQRAPAGRPVGSGRQRRRGYRRERRRTRLISAPSAARSRRLRDPARRRPDCPVPRTGWPVAGSTTACRPGPR